MDGIQVNKVTISTVILTPVESVIRTCVGKQLQVSKLTAPQVGLTWAMFNFDKNRDMQLDQH